MQVKDINIDTGKIKGYGICKKKVQNLIFRWSYHSDLLYIALDTWVQMVKFLSSVLDEKYYLLFFTDFDMIRKHTSLLGTSLLMYKQVVTKLLNY